MPDLTKIATCSYCGTRSVLRLSGKVQHELACASCGAKLHEMKPLRAEPRPRAKHSAPLPPPRHPAPQKPQKKKRGTRKAKPLFRRVSGLFGDILDEIEDFLD